MFRKTVLGPTLLALSLLATSPVFAADGAEATIHQVYEAAEAGRFSDAQSMMDKVLHDHPNSAKAHYIEAELLAKQGRLHDAQIELNTAQKLEPQLSFTSPQKVQELQNRISGAHPVATQRMQAVPVYQREAARPEAGDSANPLVTVIVIVGLIALFFFIVRMLSRRNTTVIAGGSYPAGYGPVAGGPVYPGYGPGGMGGPVVGGGMGSGIMSGLASGAAMGAGIVAGEELMHHFTDRNREEVIYETPPSNTSNNNWTRSDDMGGTDFGVSDSSSWDSGGSSSDDW